MKKLAVCGKGGCGKSTLVALLADVMNHRNFSVLVVDSDESNAGLYRKLGFDKAPEPLMEMIGGRKGIKEKMGAKSVVKDIEPRTTVLTSNKIQLGDIPAGNIVRKDGISMVSIGKILHALEGCACPMGVLNREFLKKLQMKSDELVLVDMEAGVEHFGRGVEASVDSVLIVVEPSFESLEFADRVNGLAMDIGITNIWTVLNKITSKEMASNLKDKLNQRRIAVVGCIHYDTEIFKAELDGHATSGIKAEDDAEKLLDILLDHGGRGVRDIVER